MRFRQLPIPAIVAILITASATVVALTPADTALTFPYQSGQIGSPPVDIAEKPPGDSPDGRLGCPGDLDGDGDTDWSDMCILMGDLGCMPPDECVGDADGDGDTDKTDLDMVLTNFGCPDDNVACDEPGQGALDVSVIPIDNSSVSAGDDPGEPTFDGGVTHFTFDLRIHVDDPDQDWCSAEVDCVLTDPDVEFFAHSFDFGGSPPEPALFGTYPALEFDSYWCGASEIDPGDSGVVPDELVGAIRTATELSAIWADGADTGAGIYTIQRFTIAIPAGSGAIPAVVPAGTGGDALVIGAVTGWATNASPEDGCVQFDFDIIAQCTCVGDVDGDCDADWSDLAIMLADYLCMSDCIADLSGDGVVNLVDLAILLADWGCPDGDATCDEPGPSVINMSVATVDNSCVESGDDPLESLFDGGVTHFTFDLQANVDPDEDWGAGECLCELTDPSAAFFAHVIEGYGYPPNPALFGTYPALEFDSYWCAATVIDPNQAGNPPLGAVSPTRTATELSTLWYDGDDTGSGTFTIQRVTLGGPAGGSATPPEVVPSGTGGRRPRDRHRNWVGHQCQLRPRLRLVLVRHHLLRTGR